MSFKLMIWLMSNYAVIGVFSVCEKNYPRALYWLGAFIISAAVLWMTKK